MTLPVLSRAVRKLKAARRRLFRQTHCFVYGYRDSSILQLAEPQHGGRRRNSALIRLEFKEIKKPDREEIEGLVSVDEWDIQEAEIARLLEEGWICCAAKHRGSIVATAWSFVGREFRDRHLERTLKLDPEEAYFWRVSCQKAFRGKGIITSLGHFLVTDLAQTYGKNSGLGITRIHNKPMLRNYAKMGWSRLGRIGFVEVLGVRVHYLWGREAFKATRRRFSVGV